MRLTFRRTALATATAALLISAPASAALIDFEDASPFFFSEISDGYAGFNWDQAWTMHEPSLLTAFPDLGGSGFDSGTRGEFAAYNADGNDMTITADGGELFSLGAVDLTAAWNNDLEITVTGLLDGVTAYQQTVTVDHGSASTFDFDFLGIDTLIFSSAGGSDGGFMFSGNHFVMDNLELAAGVPEPGTLSLLAAGLAGLAWRRRQRRLAADAPGDA